MACDFRNMISFQLPYEVVTTFLVQTAWAWVGSPHITPCIYSGNLTAFPSAHAKTKPNEIAHIQPEVRWDWLTHISILRYREESPRSLFKTLLLFSTLWLHFHDLKCLGTLIGYLNSLL